MSNDTTTLKFYPTDKGKDMQLNFLPCVSSGASSLESLIFPNMFRLRYNIMKKQREQGTASVTDLFDFVTSLELLSGIFFTESCDCMIECLITAEPGSALLTTEFEALYTEIRTKLTDLPAYSNLDTTSSMFLKAQTTAGVSIETYPGMLPVGLSIKSGLGETELDSAVLGKTVYVTIVNESENSTTHVQTIEGLIYEWDATNTSWSMLSYIQLTTNGTNTSNS